MLYTVDFSMRHYVGFSQVRSHMVTINATPQLHINAVRTFGSKHSIGFHMTTILSKIYQFLALIRVIPAIPT